MSEPSKLILDEAREAWEFHEKGMGWLKWIAVGRGLQECQRFALSTTHSNDMSSHAAKMAMARILEQERLDRIDKGDRSVLLKVMSELPAITAWMETLTTSERIRYNHPRAVWARFQKSRVPQQPADEKDADADADAGDAPRGYKAQLLEAMAEIDRLRQRLKSEGSLFNLNTDTPEQIAKAVLGAVVPSRAERIAAAIRKLAKERAAKGGHAG